jgi:hypothetical protein
MGLSEKSKTRIFIPTNKPDSVKNKHKLSTLQQIYSVQLDRLPTDLTFHTAPLTKQGIISAGQVFAISACLAFLFPGLAFLAFLGNVDSALYF